MARSRKSKGASPAGSARGGAPRRAVARSAVPKKKRPFRRDLEVEIPVGVSVALPTRFDEPARPRRSTSRSRRKGRARTKAGTIVVVPSRPSPAAQLAEKTKGLGYSRRRELELRVCQERATRREVLMAKGEVSKKGGVSGPYKRSWRSLVKCR